MIVFTQRLHLYHRWYSRINIYSRLLYSKRPSPYSHTVNSPKTDFPLSLDNVHQRELQIQKKCDFEGLYVWQKRLKRKERFVIHDGPPYANGKVHVGHALNKILKDIINRYKLLRGYEIVYKPGWDCHGTPIEQKTLSSVGRRVESMGAVEIRKMASQFAHESSQGQKSSFMSWGVMADWEGGCYHTYDPHYEAKQLEAFYRLYEKGLVFQQYMPIFWSPSSRTALAESEIEYVDDYHSTQAYIRLPITHLSIHGGDLDRTYALIWTTTPWTLPFNKAICYGDGVRYILVQAISGDKYVISEKFKSELDQITNSPSQVLRTFEGIQLKSSIYTSTNGESAPFLPGGHVTNDKGTALVHTAPAHGVEDFQVALKHGLPLECQVDEEGRYMGCVEGMEGRLVLEDGNKLVLDKLGDLVLHQSAFKHSYPHDWRTKQPIIIRASKQWFIDTNKIKKDAINGISGVKSYPTSCLPSMQAQLDRRDYWCISRQRYWGVPLPVFYGKSDGTPVISRASIDHLKELFSKHGSDCWWKMGVDELLPSDVLNQLGVSGTEGLEKGSDILDIWFDSGVSWFCVLDEESRAPITADEIAVSGKYSEKATLKKEDGFGGNSGVEELSGGERGRNEGISDGVRWNERGNVNKVADVYLEGLDQYGGWFMSSLLTSTALQGTPPFKNLIVHGFALDEQGRKMSKSQGNVVDPDVVVKGDENNPGYGVDVLRMWVGGCGLEPSVVIGDSALEDNKQKVFRFRKSLRYLIGCLHDYQPTHQPINNLHLTDQYMLHLLADLVNKVTESYDVFNISRVTRVLDHFNSNKLSAFYLHVIKDRLYCGDKSSRGSVQHTIHHLLHTLSKLLAPITPHLAEEVYAYHPMNLMSSSVFKTCDWFENKWQNQSLASIYESLQPIRQGVFQMLASNRSSDFEVEIYASDQLMRGLELLYHTTPSFNSPLCEFMGTADVDIHGKSSSSLSSSSSSFSSSSYLSSSSSPYCSSPPLSLSSSSSSSSSASSSSSSKSPSSSSYSSSVNKDFGDFELTLKRSHRHKCPRCRRLTSEGTGGVLCVRCAGVVEEMANVGIFAY